MPHLTHLILIIIHGFYAVKRFLSSLIPSPTPKPLLARRPKSPVHLALLLIPDAENHDRREEESVMEECVERMVGWCKELGAQRLSVYERDGVLSRKSIYASPPVCSEKWLATENIPQDIARNPLTPPPSDTDSPRPSSPDFEQLGSRPGMTTFQLPYLSGDGTAEREKAYRRRRYSHLFEAKALAKTLTLHLLSRQCSKPAIAAAARSLALAHTCSSTFELTIETLNEMLEGETGLPPPDLVIVHHLYACSEPLELHGFPPWQVRLSEIYYAPRRKSVLRHIRHVPGAVAISELDFRRALDKYSGARMKMGT